MATASGSDVRSAQTAAKNNLTQAQTEINALTSSWKGDSSTALIPKFSDKIDDYISGIEAGMESYASACDEYENYEELKEKKKELEDKIDKYAGLIKQMQDSTTPNPYAATSISSFVMLKKGAEKKLEKTEEKLKESKEKIKEYLSQSKKAVSSLIQAKPKAPKQAKTAAVNPFMIENNVNGVAGMYLGFDEKQIFQVLGKQQSGDSCGVYAMAYGWNILEGKNRVSSDSTASESAVKRAYNDGTSYCQWYNMSSKKYSSSKERLNAIWDEVVGKNKPVIAAVQGSSVNHYVCCVGVRKGAKKANLKPSDLIIVDSAAPNNMLCYYGQGWKNNFDGSHYGLQLITFNGDRKQTK